LPAQLLLDPLAEGDGLHFWRLFDGCPSTCDDLSLARNHCDDPACLAGCPAAACQRGAARRGGLHRLPLLLVGTRL
jgi:hypothetical protein